MTTGQIIIVSVTTILAIYCVYLLIKDRKKEKNTH